ncbi:MAG: hypothetical protein QM504_01045 [Pseudomonadota bacterium]
MNYKYILSVVLLAVVYTNNVFAGEYFGFKLGLQNISQITTQLKKSGASFEPDYGYKGYSNDLRVFKIISLDKFSKYGSLKDAWLSFSPDKKLYKITVTWSDPGKTFKLLHDALVSKYKRPEESGTGFVRTYKFKDGDVDFKLVRNTFGFGSRQTTNLEYIFKPALSKVKEMKARIEEDIKNKNAKKASTDL